VILGGLALLFAGSVWLVFLRPDTAYGVVLVGLVLIGVGNIAVTRHPRRHARVAQSGGRISEHGGTERVRRMFEAVSSRA
jgi:hypothetical protein